MAAIVACVDPHPQLQRMVRPVLDHEAADLDTNNVVMDKVLLIILIILTRLLFSNIYIFFLQI